MPVTLEETVNVSAQQLQLMLKLVMRLVPVLHGELQKSVVSKQFFNDFWPRLFLDPIILIVNK